MNKPSLIGPKRHLFQWSLAILWVGVPFLKANGRPLIEIDLPNLAFYLGGGVFRIEEMHLFWLLTMAAIFLFLFLTMVLGRVWCGWGCPQTAFTDLAEGFARRIGMRVENNRLGGSVMQQTALHLLYLLIALLAGCSFVWYFVPPAEFFGRLAGTSLGPWPLGTALTLATVVLLDLTLLRRLFCREFCPYGRFQTIIVQPATLTLRSLPTEIDRCIDCKACVRSCPMGIDIRDGFQIECINCTRCLDACSLAMAPRRQPGIIGYTVGTAGRGWRALLNPRMIVIGLLFLTLLSALFYAASHRTPVSLKLQRAPEIPARLLENDQALTFFTGYLRNLSTSEIPLRISAATPGGEQLELKGPTQIILPANGKKPLRFGVIATNPPKNSHREIVFSVYSQDGKIIESRAYITHIEAKSR